MKVISSLFRPIRWFWDILTRLGLRFLILTVLSLILLNVAILTAVSRTNPNFELSLRGPPIVRQAAAAAKLLDTLDTESRNVALAALNSSQLRLTIRSDFSETPPVANPSPVFVPIIALYNTVLGDRPFSVYQRTHAEEGITRFARLTDDLIIVIRLADGSALVVESGSTYRRLVSFYGLAYAVGILGLVLVGFMVWASLSYVRPLGRLASASANFAQLATDQTKHNPLPEIGPKPVRDLAVALNETGNRLAQLMAERTTTLAAVAHDLRTYLTRLRMRSEFIEDNVQRDKIVRDIEDMSQLVEDTLLLGKSVATTSTFERLELAAWLSDFVARRAELGDPVSLQHEIIYTEVDVSVPELTRALNNLVDNALRYAGEAMIILHAPAPKEVVIEVLDRGPGVPEPFLKQISDPFTRLEGSRSRDTGGAGLGLAIAKALVEQVGGSLTLGNREEGGFCARIQLPSV